MSYEQLVEYLSGRIDRTIEDVDRNHDRINDWYRRPGNNSTKAVLAAGRIGVWKRSLAFASQQISRPAVNSLSAIDFGVEYINNLTRLDGSRPGPVGLLSNGFAIVDCLAAGRFNNAQVLRDQAVQLLNQRAYEDQDAYAEDKDLLEDPENYVEIIPQRIFVFAHELLGQRAGQKAQPWEGWDIIGDEDYIAAARAVYTEDMEEAARVLCRLCNFHVQYSNPFPEGDDDDRLAGFEFDTPVRSLWPTEVFAWLRLRQERRLALPDVIHPLLEQPLGRFDPQIPVEWPHEPWFEELVQKLVEFHPRYADLPRLVFEAP